MKLHYQTSVKKFAPRRPLQTGLLSLVLGFSFSLGLTGCAAVPTPPPITQAEAVSNSRAAAEAKEYAPQAYAAAEKLRAEANWLNREGRRDEASVAGESAIAAYTHAFTLSRVAKADARLKNSQAEKKLAQAKVDELDRLQNQVAKEADAYELRARIHLDTEEVKDVKSLSPEHARARQKAARQLSAEAAILCLATRLLNKNAKDVPPLEKKLERLGVELSHGSVKQDLYPRAAELRSQCLGELSRARRPIIERAPESAASDRLLKELTETGKVFAYRDDRGIVINLGSPVDKKGELTKASLAVLKLLAGTAQTHPSFPLIVAAHTAKKGQKERSKKLGEATEAALLSFGAKSISLYSVENAQPVVSTRVRGAAERNERVEIIFVAPGR